MTQPSNSAGDPTPNTPATDAPTAGASTTDAPTADPTLHVDTTGGTVAGFTRFGTHAWLGIPYAEAPVGTRRFRRPERAPREGNAWDGAREATAFGPSPVQPPLAEAFGGIGDDPEAAPQGEDCLTLNVVRPANPQATGPLPVMVWIYGGAFLIGGTKLYPAHEFARRADVVHVSMNYRVGAFGFFDLTSLSTDEYSFESNAGLHDQIAALQWVQENIAAFGGDPENVTIFGESAGAMSVLALMCMPAARGLFHRAIAQSPAPASGYPAELHAEWALAFARFLAPEAVAAGPEATARALVEASTRDIQSATARTMEWVKREYPGKSPLAPCIDGESLPAKQLGMLAEGTAAPVPLVIGTNENEGRLFRMGLDAGRSEETVPVTEESLTRILAVRPGFEDLLAEYPGWPEAEAASQLGGDLLFWYPSTVAADSHSHHAPVWMYRYDYVSGIPAFGAGGATHGAEIAHLYGRSLVYAQQRKEKGLSGFEEAGERDTAFSEALIGLWSTFAHTGVPGNWPEYDAVKRRTLVLDHPLRAEANPWAAKREAWERYLHGR